jgi:hypothetical protein
MPAARIFRASGQPDRLRLPVAWPETKNPHLFRAQTLRQDENFHPAFRFRKNLNTPMRVRDRLIQAQWQVKQKGCEFSAANSPAKLIKMMMNR